MISRRNLLGTMVAATIGAAAAPALSFAEVGGGLGTAVAKKASRRAIPWRNWSGSQECFPQARKAPASLIELQEVVAAAKGCVRPVGAGHSFMPLVPTDDTIVSLSRMSGVISHDSEKLQARIMAGTRLGDIGAPLAERGQAMINMPDIDQQSLAGALGTATHGTGAALGCLPSFVEGLQLVTASGEVIECDRSNNREIFESARVNLGALGIVTEVTLQNVPTYRLKRETIWASFEDLMAQADSLADNNRNFEFFYIPFSGVGYYDVHNITTEEPYTTAKMDQNDGVQTLKDIRDWLSWSPKLRELIMTGYSKTLDKEVKVATSWQNYASERSARFNEMEYHLPRENGLKAMREVHDTLEKNFPEVFFPIEVRYVKGDDIWLSPFNGRESMSIAVHRYFDEDFKPYFKAIEPIFRKYGGRPHWGKLNTMAGPDFAARYPHWKDFKAVRQELDPNGKFLNPYLKGIFEVA